MRLWPDRTCEHASNVCLSQLLIHHVCLSQLLFIISIFRNKSEQIFILAQLFKRGKLFYDRISYKKMFFVVLVVWLVNVNVSYRISHISQVHLYVIVDKLILLFSRTLHFILLHTFIFSVHFALKKVVEIVRSWPVSRSDHNRR